MFYVLHPLAQIQRVHRLKTSYKPPKNLHFVTHSSFLLLLIISYLFHSLACTAFDFWF